MGPVSRCLLSDKKINFHVGATMQICAGATQFAEQTEVNRQEKTVTSQPPELIFGHLSVQHTCTVLYCDVLYACTEDS